VQEIATTGDKVLADTLRRGVIRLIDEISEPLTDVKLQIEDKFSFGKNLVKIRNEHRNPTTHEIRETDDIIPHYELALQSLHQNMSDLFEKTYPGMRKALLIAVKEKTQKEYEVCLGEYKRDRDAWSGRSDEDIAEFITLLSSSPSRPGVSRGAIRSSLKLSKGPNSCTCL
jgi:hypothetical protein